MIIVLAGSAARLVNLGTASLWYDEAVIWLISHAPLAQLLDTNSQWNSSTPVYPLLVRGVEGVWGNSEAQLRSLSAIGGILAMPALFALARRSMSTAAATVATGFMAFSYEHVFYSRELREYELGVLMTVLVWLTLDRALASHPQWKPFAVYTLVASASLILQFGLIAVVAVSQSILVLDAILHRRHSARWSVAGSSLVVGVVAALTYLLILRPMMAVKPLTFSYLESNYLIDVSPTGIVGHLWENSRTLLQFADFQSVWFPLLHWIIFLCGVAIGTAFLWLQAGSARRLVLYAFGPVVGVAILSLVRVYPYGGVRQDLFLTPALYALAAAGFAAPFSRVSRQGLSQWLIGSLMLAPIALALPSLWSIAVKGGNFRSAVEYLAGNAADGDAIYVYWAAAPAYHYYWEDRSFGTVRESDPVVWGNRYSDAATYAADVTRCFAISDRCWIVLSNLGGDQINEARQILMAASVVASEHDTFVPEGSLSEGPPADPSVFLFEARR